MLPRICSSDAYSCSSAQRVNSRLRYAQMRGAMLEQRRDHLDGVGARHDGLHGVDRLVHAAAHRERAAQAAEEHGQPSQPEQQLRRVREVQARRRLEVLGIDVGLVEPVEQDEAGGAEAIELPGEVRHRRVERRELHGQGDRDRLPQHGDDVDDAPLDGEAVFEQIGGDVVEVQLERVGAGPLDEPRVLQPPCGRRAVQRRDHRHAARAP